MQAANGVNPRKIFDDQSHLVIDFLLQAVQRDLRHPVKVINSLVYSLFSQNNCYFYYPVVILFKYLIITHSHVLLLMKHQTKTAALLILLITSVIYISTVIYSDSEIQSDGEMNLLRASDRQAEKYLKEGKHHFE